MAAYPSPISVVELSQRAAVLSIESLREHCSVVAIDGSSDADSSPDDQMLLGMLDAAVSYAEGFTGRSIAPITLQLRLDEFPDGAIRIERGPLIEVTAFTIGGEGTDAVDVDADDYFVDRGALIHTLRPYVAWPTVVKAPATVRITYRAGYATETQESDVDTEAIPLPGGIRAALLLTVGHLYANREATTATALSSLPLGVQSMLGMHRVRAGFA